MPHVDATHSQGLRGIRTRRAPSEARRADLIASADRWALSHISERHESVPSAAGGRRHRPLGRPSSTGLSVSWPAPSVGPRRQPDRRETPVDQQIYASR